MQRGLGGGGGVWESVPITTMFFLAVNVGAYVAQWLLNPDLHALSIAAAPVLFYFEFYRFISAAFLHLGLLHIAMNMMSLYAMGSALESLFGSVFFFVFVLAAVVLVGAMYTLLAATLAFVTRDWSYLASSGVGFSGVLFTLAVEESALSREATRRVFGLFTVPTRLYPWVLLIVLQFLLPGVSFLGHLAGLLVGLLHVSGFLRWLFPSFSTIHAIENMRCLARVRRLPSFFSAPVNDPVDFEDRVQDPNAPRRPAWRTRCPELAFVTDFVSGVTAPCWQPIARRLGPYCPCLQRRAPTTTVLENGVAVLAAPGRPSSSATHTAGATAPLPSSSSSSSFSSTSSSGGVGAGSTTSGTFASGAAMPAVPRTEGGVARDIELGSRSWDSADGGVGAGAGGSLSPSSLRAKRGGAGGGVLRGHHDGGNGYDDDADDGAGEDDRTRLLHADAPSPASSFPNLSPVARSDSNEEPLASPGHSHPFVGGSHDAGVAGNAGSGAVGGAGARGERSSGSAASGSAVVAASVTSAGRGVGMSRLLREADKAVKNR